MTPEAARYLDKAQRCMLNAQMSLGINLTNDAGRGAYLAAFHAAQALIFERTGKVAKTHMGVHGLFVQLVKEEPQLDDRLPGFLKRTYNLKAVADYETGPDSDIAPERAAAAVEGARTFVDAVRRVLMSCEPNITF